MFLLIRLPSTSPRAATPSRPARPDQARPDAASRFRLPRALAIAAFAALGVAGCAQAPQPQQLAAGHGKEYFPSSVYGPASRRVVADGQPIPHGGGQYLVGKPYTVAGQTYYPSERAVRQIGLASWYGDAFHGRLTANGEIYDREGFTAAHPTMPLPSYARVTNLRNNYTMVVRVNDRGPYHAGRVMDVSRRVAEALDFQRGGTAKIKVEYVGRASLAGSDDAKLYATLRRGDGGAGPEERSLVAEAAPAAPSRLASLLPFASGDRRAEVARPDALRERAEQAEQVEAHRERAEVRREEIESRRRRDDARREQAEAGREDAEVRREEAGARRERADARMVTARRERDRRDDESVPNRGARTQAAQRAVAEERRPDSSDRRRLAALAAEPPRVAREGRLEGRGGARRVASDEAALPTPRPPARDRATAEQRSSDPMPPRRLRFASAEPVHKSGGTRLTRSRED